MPQVGAFPRDSELMESRILFAHISRQGFSSRLDDSSSALAKAEFPRTPSYGKGFPRRTLPQSSSALARESFVSRGSVSGSQYFVGHRLRWH